MTSRRVSRNKTNQTQFKIGLSFQQDAKLGVIVSEIKKGFPGDLAGVQIGDRIRSLEGIVTRTINDFIKALNSSQPYQTIVMEIARTTTRDVSVVCAEQPSGGGKPYVGMAFASTGDGLLISSVEPNGPVDRAGVMSGTTVLAVNGTRTKSLSDFRNVMAHVQARHTVVFNVIGPTLLKLNVKLGAQSNSPSPPSSQRPLPGTSSSAPSSVSSSPVNQTRTIPVSTETGNNSTSTPTSSSFFCCSSPAAALSPTGGSAHSRPNFNPNQTVRSQGAGANAADHDSLQEARQMLQVSRENEEVLGREVDKLKVRWDEAVAKKMQAEDMYRQQCAELQQVRKQADLLQGNGLDDLSHDELMKLDAQLKTAQSKVMQQMFVVIQTNTKKEVSANLEEKSNCIICQTHKKSQLFYPCGHVCACESCAARIDVCPLCRVGIQRRIQAFT